ncbi:hypothetical protein PIB30_038351 [Stylosanthes scabra]|uniref:AAA ATPase AAA+ lid domain-containing protein n=1 Tax=Stylosanthes scabra TaxID=79078 RepID=A0ABU6YCW2_9FABA|nr:hypothetical protein [Stylosanthes scabra]
MDFLKNPHSPSHLIDTEDECKEIDERLTIVLLYNIDINPPEDATHLCNWNSQLEEDMRMIQFQDNKTHITEVLAANDIDCDDLSSICHANTMVLSTYIEEIVVSAISCHLMNTKDLEYRNGKLIISANRKMLKVLPEQTFGVENREKILKTLLAKEKHENLDFKELAAMTEGYTGSDVKNLCITAAYRPVRELLQHERNKDMKKNETEGQNSEDASENREDHQITLRCLNMEDMRQAKSQMAASFASEGTVMNLLKQRNKLYGEGALILRDMYLNKEEESFREFKVCPSFSQFIEGPIGP